MSRSRVVLGALLVVLCAILFAPPTFAACIVQADGWTGSANQHVWAALTDSANAIILECGMPGYSRLSITAPPDTDGIVGVALDRSYNRTVNLYYSDGRVYQVWLGDCSTEPTWYLVHTIPASCILQSTAIGTVPKPRFQRNFRSAPNPTTHASTVEFTLKTNSRVTAVIYDAQGKLVRSVVSAMMDIGPHTLRWDGVSDDGTPCPPGQYFWRVISADGVFTTKTIVLR